MNLKQRLPVKENEWQRLLDMSVVFLPVTIGIELARVARDCFFLSTAGAEKIPLMYVFVAGLSIVASFFYKYLASKIEPILLLTRMIYFGCGIVIASGTLVAFYPNWRLLPPMVFCSVESLAIVLLLHTWAVVEIVFDAWESKRLFPLVGAVGLIGKLLSGLVINIVVDTIGVSGLFFLPSS